MIRVDCTQQTPEWYDVRRGVLTASHFNKILTPKTQKVSAQADAVARRIVAEWLSGVAEQPPATQAMERGIMLEPEARAWYEFATGRTVEEVGFVFLNDKREIGCSPDGLIGDDGGLEIKCLNGADHIEALANGQIPIDYVPQVQGCLWITGREWWDYVSYHPLMPSEVIRVARDDTFIKSLEIAADYVLGLVEAMKRTLTERGIGPKED